jgi:hypothetical protein
MSAPEAEPFSRQQGESFALSNGTEQLSLAWSAIFLSLTTVPDSFS